MSQAIYFIDVIVEPHTEIPNGLCMRWKAEGQSRPVSLVQYEPDQGPDGAWLVSGRGRG